MLARVTSALASAAASAATSAATSAVASAALEVVASRVGSMTHGITKKASAYRSEIPFEVRVADARRLREQYPDRIAIIVEPADANQPTIDKRKFLVPDDLSVGQLLYVIRKRIKLAPEQALFLMTSQGSIPPNGSSLRQLYDQSHDDDMHMYFTYATEHAFGSSQE